MSNTPAGWYSDSRTPGTPRYWNGVAWLAPGEGPAAAAAGFSQEVGASTPSATAQPAAGFRPTPAQNYGDASAWLAPPVLRATLGNQVASGEQEATWDVVGVPRQPVTPVAPASPPPEPSPQSELSPPREPSPQSELLPQPEWLPAANPAYRSVSAAPASDAPTDYATSTYAATDYATSAYTEPPPLGYNPVRAAFRRSPVRAATATVIGTAVIGFGARWVFGLFFGPDFSDDGPIGIDIPAYWTTISASNPNITYAMDGTWTKVADSTGTQLAPPGMKLIDARTVTTVFSGSQAFLVFVASPDQTPGKKASREVFEAAFNSTLDKMAAKGASVLSREKVTVLKSNAGDNWGISSAKISRSGSTLTIYDAEAIIDGYTVEVELIVPDGVSLRESEILAVVNSVGTRDLTT